MAAKKGTTLPAEPAAPSSTALAQWEEQLAAQAEAAVATEAGVAGGQFFSFKGGVIKFNDAEIGTELPVIILDHILENAFYEGRYDANNPTPPTCFAFGRTDDELKPHDVVEEPQHDACSGCPMNEWASSDTGKGKACKNVRRLALIPAGHFDDEGEFVPATLEEIQSSPLAFARLPVTSTRPWAAFVKSVAGTLKRPPHGVISKMTCVPDDADQFKVLFSPVAKLPVELLGIIMQRHEEAKAAIAFPYAAKSTAAPAPAKKPAGRLPTKTRR